MSMYKVKAAIAGGALACVMAAAAIGGSVIQAMSGDAYKSWKQYGESWSSMTLGSSGETVARSGCAVTSAAILMAKSGSVTDDSFTPATIISFMSANGGFSSSGSINWNKLTSYAPSFVYCGKASLSGTQQQKAEKMQSLIEQGYYLAAVVKNGGHFVAVDSVNGSQVTMMDPGSKSTSLFEKYAASGVISLRLFKGANSAAVASEVKETAIPAETTELITTTEIETAETTVLYTTAPAEEPTASPAETTVIVTTTTVAETTTTETETTTSETKKETTTTVMTTPAPQTTVQTVVTVAATEPAAELTAPAMPVSPRPAETIIASRAEAGLFQIQGKNIFMTVRFTTTDNLHLREEANTASDILLVIPEGTQLDVVEIDEAFKWGRVAYNGKEGWISLDYAGL